MERKIQFENVEISFFDVLNTFQAYFTRPKPFKHRGLYNCIFLNNYPYSEYKQFKTSYFSSSLAIVNDNQYFVDQEVKDTVVPKIKHLREYQSHHFIILSSHNANINKMLLKIIRERKNLYFENYKNNMVVVPILVSIIYLMNKIL